MEQLSAPRAKVLKFIRSFSEKHSYPPSVRDIQRGCNISSTSVVDFYLKALERDGYLTREKGISRGLGLVGYSREKRNTVPVPLLGTIAAGEPIPVPQADTWDSVSGSETIDLPAELAGRGKSVYALRVKGTSMVDALIGDGDIVLMEPPRSVNEGDMVAVWLKGDKAVTLKRIYRERDQVRLQPANTQMRPIYASPEDVEVQGRVVGVVRTY